MPWNAVARPWIKTETDHHYGTRKKVEVERFWMNKCCACPCFWRRTSEETNILHGQNWAISESEKEDRWNANKKKYEEELRNYEEESEILDGGIDKGAQEGTEMEEMQQLLPTQEHTSAVKYGAIMQAA